jgi:hypothetical protein
LKTITTPSGRVKTFRHTPDRPAAGQALRPAVVYPTAAQRIQAVSEVVVLYDAQFSVASLRVQGNVDTLATAAFHERAHNKYEGEP